MRQPEQWALFDGPREPLAVIPPIDPNVHPGDGSRLSRQSAAIVGRLREGPATNAELAGIALKYTGRISDSRHAGYDIRMIRRAANGLTWYALFEGGVMVGSLPPEEHHG